MGGFVVLYRSATLPPEGRTAIPQLCNFADPFRIESLIILFGEPL